MSKERELLKEVLKVLEWNGIMGSHDTYNRIKELLAQPEQDKKSKVDFQTLSEMGLKRLQVSDELVLQEGCSKSPTVIFAENGDIIEVIGYKKLLEIRSFIDEILNYADTPQIGVDYEH